MTVNPYTAGTDDYFHEERRRAAVRVYATMNDVDLLDNMMRQRRSRAPHADERYAYARTEVLERMGRQV